MDDATATPIFIDYHLAPDWFEGVAGALDALDEHLAADATAVLLLADHMIQRLAAGAINDSDGWLTQAVPARLLLFEQREHARSQQTYGFPSFARAGRDLAARG